MTSEQEHKGVERIKGDHALLLTWLQQEAAYARDKTGGYDARMERLSRDPSDPTSVYGFMSQYWHRFLLMHEQLVLASKAQPGAVEALRYAQVAWQQLAKVAAGMLDKVAAGMLDKVAAGLAQRESLVADVPPADHIAVAAMLVNVGYDGGLLDDISAGEVGGIIAARGDFARTPMGLAVRDLHAAYDAQTGSIDTAAYASASVRAAVAGLRYLEVYSSGLQEAFASFVFPAPGRPSGEIVSWDEK